ncbi:hypothetical protein PSTG_04895 [Puccinia striiformis f. sp. tritici PST-78]|uniref:Uncharacterized protein n=1 Tax=Puccinia striiformis f. sp. tritici PST-78 TaxID=1165861 RepID=A0A0L0VR70_9BASI|nr:hypothetical protein PSTG_04895 [Puccinia striiformis f. sp. tritici PST-78]
MEWILSVGVRKLLQDKVIERRRLEEKNLREEVLTQAHNHLHRHPQRWRGENLIDKEDTLGLCGNSKFGAVLPQPNSTWPQTNSTNAPGVVIVFYGPEKTTIFATCGWNRENIRKISEIEKADQTRKTVGSGAKVFATVLTFNHSLKTKKDAVEKTTTVQCIYE